MCTELGKFAMRSDQLKKETEDGKEVVLIIFNKQ